MYVIVMRCNGYPKLLVKLGGMVVEVHDSEGNNLLIAIIVAPMATSWNGEDVTPTNPMNPLMLVCSPALLGLLAFLDFPVGFLNPQMSGTHKSLRILGRLGPLTLRLLQH